MAIILDIAGKPLPARNTSKKRLRAQALRDLLKVLIVLALIIMGYLLFAPTGRAPHAAQAASQQVTSAD
jgi:uncharacterized protein (UPF0333 family)